MDSAKTDGETKQTALVEVDDLTFRYANGKKALDHVSLALDRASIMTVIGPSGCGKSTLLNLVAGLDQPSSGAINRHDDLTKRDVGFVFQDATLMPWASVFDNVWLPLRFRGRTRDQARPAIETALNTVGLADVMDQHPERLSGGMKMRVSIARALVTQPKLLLMDEPFAALDETNRFALNDEVISLAQTEGLTVLFVTHSVYEAVYISDRIAVMSASPGTIVERFHVDPGSERGTSFRNSEAYLRLTTQIAEAVRKAGLH